MRRRDDDIASRWGGIPAGPMIILIVAILSSGLLAARPSRSLDGARMWTFARLHHQIYESQVASWNNGQSGQLVAQSPERPGQSPERPGQSPELPGQSPERPGQSPERPGQSPDATIKVNLSLLSLLAIEQRMLSAFLAETTVAELIEVERRNAARAFAGPLESVGFVDLTDRLKAEGLDQVINPASFSPWTSRGRIFGLPHDVHPVMLGYRADIVEAAGIDVSRIETWDDFVRAFKPLMKERDTDGRPRRYLLNLWETHFEVIELLLLQAGGGLFDSAGRPTLDDPINAMVLAQMASWCTGPDRIAADAPYFSASGNKLLLDGFVVASFLPDWMCNIWRNEIPQLAGKVKVMPLPAWKPGGRRTSVWGGTMLGISRTAQNQDALWNFAKHLYLSPESARELYTRGDIVTPVRTLWSDPVFDQPDAYFSAQKKGRMYIELAPHVPPRHSSPFGSIAADRLQSACVAIAAFARKNPNALRADLEAEALRILKHAQENVWANVRRNTFVSETLGGQWGVAHE